MKKRVLCSIVCLCIAASGLLAEQAADDPIVKWTAPWPDVNKPNAGLEILAGAEHYEIFHATPDYGMYNHGVVSTHFGGNFYVMWYSHLNCEDAAGQRVLFASSANGKQWNKTVILFDRLCPPSYRGTSGINMHPNGFYVVDGRMYAAARANCIEWNEGGSPLYKNNALLARRINGMDSFGDIFWLSEELDAAGMDLPKYPTSAQMNAQIKADTVKLLEMIDAKAHENGPMPPAPEGTKLCEANVYTRPDGKQVRLYRDDGRSLRLYASIRDNANESWSVPVKTNIPDSCALNRTGYLPDGRIFLIGNNLEKLWLRTPLLITFSTDGISFSDSYVIRCCAPQLREKKSMDGKGPGFQYPNVCFVDGDMWVFYSVGKEDINVTRIPLDTLPKSK